MILDIYKDTPTVNVSSLISRLSLDSSRLSVETDTGGTLEYEFEINSNEFLRYAEMDLESGDNHGLINALSNAKRAIDCQVEKVLGCFRLLSRRNFPQKMELLRNMGIVAPRIVNKVVKARNYLEHEFKIPDKEQVEDAIDIANLFVTSLDRALHFFPLHYELGTVIDGVYDDYNNPTMDKTISIYFEEEDPQFILIGFVFNNPETEVRVQQHIIGKSIILPNEKGYVELIKFSLEVEKGVSDLRVSAENLLSIFQQSSR